MAKWSQIYRVFINPFAEEADEPELIGGRRMPVVAAASSWGRTLGWALAVVLVLLWESAFRDANRLLNLYYPQCIEHLAGECSAAAYVSTKLFFLFLVVLPLAVFLIAFRRLLADADPHPALIVLFRAYAASVVWMAARLLLDLLRYLLVYHRTLGVYAVLGMLIALLIAFIYTVTNHDLHLIKERKE